MGVKKYLAKANANFVSLDDVLRSMMKVDGCSYEEAATVLLMLMNKESDAPSWYVKSQLRGVERDHGKSGIGCLTQAVLEGDPIPF